MAITDIFKKKEPSLPPFNAPPVPSGPPSDVPLQQVITLQSQGLSNNQIIQTLQRQGYLPAQIYDALAQSEAKKGIEPMSIPLESAPKLEPRKEERHPDSEALVEQIIEEKWHDLQKDISKMSEWKDAQGSRLDKMEQALADMKSDLDGLHKAIVARIGEYDKTLMDVGTEIKAMEKVFQKVLPELTGNIQELSRITKTVKGPTSLKK